MVQAYICVDMVHVDYRNIPLMYRTVDLVSTIFDPWPQFVSLTVLTFRKHHIIMINLLCLHESADFDSTDLDLYVSLGQTP